MEYANFAAITALSVNTEFLAIWVWTMLVSSAPDVLWDSLSMESLENATLALCTAKLAATELVTPPTTLKEKSPAIPA